MFDRSAPRPLVAIVEDDSATLRALGRMLTAHGFEAIGYASAEAFLGSPPSRLPACLVVDINLQGMSGLELQRRLRALGSTLPVVVLTGGDDPRVRIESERLGCAGYLLKDSDGDALPGLIKSLLPPRPD